MHNSLPARFRGGAGGRRPPTADDELAVRAAVAGRRTALRLLTALAPQKMFEADRLVIAGLAAALLGLIYYRACRRTAQVEPFDLSAQHAPASAAAKLSDLAAQADAACYELDVYGKGGALHAFEAEVAALLSKPAACFFATGTAAQQAVCYAHTHATDAGTAGGRDHPHAAPALVLVHGTSHLVYLDCLRDAKSQVGAFQQAARDNLPDFEVLPFCRVPNDYSTDDFARVPTCEDVERALRAGRHARGRRPAVVVLELPQRMNGGATIPFDELQRISTMCRERSVRLHCDGARLWEVRCSLVMTFDDL